MLNINFTIGIFLDFEKDLDSVKHNILFDKLERYGIRGIPHHLLKSYLYNCFQFVRFGNGESSLRKIEYGVTQGSILGPLLFLLYVNDIALIPETQYVVLYADDTNVFFHDADLPEIVTQADMWTKKLSPILVYKSTNP